MEFLTKNLPIQQSFQESSNCLEKLRDKPVRIAADAQYDSPGFCAKYCYETIMDADSGVCLYSSVHSCGEEQFAHVSTRMEPIALKEGLEILMNNQQNPLAITDMVSGSIHTATTVKP